MKFTKSYSNIQIIAGLWKGRKINFNAKLNIKPTPNRIRETIFNWLAQDIVDANCLDLFAGSGVLGFEALSRQAKLVTSIEKEPAIAKDILANRNILGANLLVECTNSITFLQKRGQNYDIIFIDPPYEQQLLPRVLQLLAENNWTKSGSLIYYEHNAMILEEILPIGWQLLKSKKAGQVYYYLARVQ